MNKCAAPNCRNTATKNSDLCLSHAIEAGGALALVSALTGNLLPDMYYPAPVTPPRTIWDGIFIAVKSPESEDTP